MNEKNEINLSDALPIETGFRSDFKRDDENGLEIEGEEETKGKIDADFPRMKYRQSWTVLKRAEGLSRETDEEECKILCQFWDEMDTCIKYEKIFNFNIEKAVKMRKEVNEKEDNEETSIVPNLKCFSVDFQLDLKQVSHLTKSKYKELSPMKLKKQLYHILFHRKSMIENPFVLDLQIKNWSNSKNMPSGGNNQTRTFAKSGCTKKKRQVNCIRQSTRAFPTLSRQSIHATSCPFKSRFC